MKRPLMLHPSDELLEAVRAGAWWRRQAACVDVEREVFYDRTRQREALTYCQQCPVSNCCLDYALKWESEYGVFGGYSARQRARLRPELTHYAKEKLRQGIWGSVPVLGSDDGLEQAE